MSKLVARIKILPSESEADIDSIPNVLKQTLPEGDHFLAPQHGIEICVGSEHAVHGSYDQVGRGTRVGVHEDEYLA